MSNGLRFTSFSYVRVIQFDLNIMNWYDFIFASIYFLFLIYES
jgi:hypothetical protein